MLVRLTSLAALAALASAQCASPPLDLNAATAEQLDARTFHLSETPTHEHSIFRVKNQVSARPDTRSPKELTEEPKKISGITVNRLSSNWKW